MERNKIFEKVNEIFRDVFEDEELIIHEETTASDIEDWDSLTHLSLINEIEMQFGVRFTMAEIQNSKNVGELITALEKHLS